MIALSAKQLPPLPTAPWPRSSQFSADLASAREAAIDPPLDSTMPGPTTVRTPPMRSPVRGRSLDEGKPVNQMRPGDGGPDRDGRDSHEISISPRGGGRDSLVDNLLLSLDQFAGDQSAKVPPRMAYASSFAQRSPRTSTDDVAPVPGRPRGHTHSSSLSSETDPRGLDLSSRYSANLARGRRSNSSSNFQSVLGRIDSLRGEDKTRRLLAELPPGNADRGQAGRTSTDAEHPDKLDSTSRPLLISPRWTGSGAARAASFDDGSHDRGPLSPHPDLFAHDPSPDPHTLSAFADFDAAPTPTVPGGPRGQHSPVRGDFVALPPTCPAPEVPLKDDRKAAKLPRALYAAGAKADGYGDLQSSVSPTPRQTSFSAAPGPTIAYQKAAPTSPVPATAPARDRPSFFRRVFGSSKHHAPAARSAPSPDRSPAPEPEPRPSRTPSHDVGPLSASSRGRLNHIADQMKTSSSEAPAVPPKDSHPPLTKRPSSFFRRRKKSLSDAPPPPVVPLDPVRLSHAPPETVVSPASSLRRVMNPYLRRPSSTQFHEAGDTGPAVKADQGTSGVASRLFRSMSKEQLAHAESLPNLAAASPGNRVETRPAGPGEERSSTLSKSHTVAGDFASAAVADAGSAVGPTPTKEDRPAPESASTARERSDSDAVAVAASGPARSPARASEPAPETSASAQNTEASDAAAVSASEPTAEDRDKVKKIYDGGEEFIGKDAAAAWLGESGPASARARRAYMELFDWTNLSILAAMRTLCAKLILKAETQQVDRLLDAVARRWCQCNAHHGFKATDVVHTICYSILLLNTDMYLADIEQKMTRSQYVKNTMPTIRRVAAEAGPDGSDGRRASAVLSPSAMTPTTEPNSPGLAPTPTRAEAKDGAAEPRDRSRRMSASDEMAHRAPTPSEAEPANDDGGPLVKAAMHGSSRAWEAQIEVVLKDIYSSIRAQRLPLHGASDDATTESAALPPSSLSVLTGGMLRRSPSTVSRAASETASFRGRSEITRTGTGRWSSKTRSRPRLYPRSTVGSSRTSFEDEASIWSPTGSSTWSRYSLGKTQTSMSVDSFGSSLPQGDYQQAIGFANALSRAIIRDEALETSTNHERVVPLLEDETLGLAGAPWAKEGILKHKHHLESVDKKAKDRHWNECFAVIENGWMRLFSFAGKGSMRSRHKARQASGGVVGGGNWSENAEALGAFLLRQTIASALPPPGYSKTRPHVWALSLPTGAVHLFQVGTPDIVKEFVSTANYWSARLSKEPLVGGISNVEYGWGENLINGALGSTDNVPTVRPANSRRPSIQSSIRSSIDQGSSARIKLPGDRILISDWSPPQQSMMASQLLEVDQLNALLTYVKNIEADLQRHNELRSPMLLAFTPRNPNANKAMANWERKSSYLLREIVKFRTYIDCLTSAQTQKEKVYAERAAGGNQEAAAQEENTTAAATADAPERGEDTKDHSTAVAVEG